MAKPALHRSDTCTSTPRPTGGERQRSGCASALRGTESRRPRAAGTADHVDEIAGHRFERRRGLATVPAAMFDRTSPRYWLLRFGLGLFLLVAAGLGVVPRLLRVGDPLGLMTLLVGLIGFRMAFHAAGPLVRVMGADRRLRDQWSGQQRARSSRARRCRGACTGC